MANHDVPAAVAAAVAAVFEGETTAETAAEDGHHQEDLSETDPDLGRKIDFATGLDRRHPLLGADRAPGPERLLLLESSSSCLKLGG